MTEWHSSVIHQPSVNTQSLMEELILCLNASLLALIFELRCSCFLFLFRGSNISLFGDLWRKIKYPNLKFFCCNTFHLCSVFFFLYFFVRGCEHAVNNDNYNIYMYTMCYRYMYIYSL